MKEEVIDLKELENLLEYSTTLPTGTTIGKRWRRALRPRADVTEWWIGAYVEHPDPKLVGIEWAWAVSELGVPHRTNSGLRLTPA